MESGWLLEWLETTVNENDAWKNILLIPFLATILSCSTLLLHVLVEFCFKSHQRVSTKFIIPELVHDSVKEKLRDYANSQGGPVILGFKVARFLSCLTLFSLTLVTIGEKLVRQHLNWDIFGLENFTEVGLAISYWYATFLAAISLTNSKWTRLVTRHNIFILLTIFSIYFYRDVWPLATYTRRPADEADDRLLWPKVAVLAFTSVFIPLFIPRQYIPVDPKNPMDVLNPEQTASMFSIMVYSFLDSIIFEAYRIPHLPHTRLPVLADRDRSKHLTKKSFPHLDVFHGAIKRHIFFGLIKIFYWEHILMATAIIFQVLASFASPVALNRILASLETERQTDSIRTWFWVVCLFFGPLAHSICFQAYVYISTRSLAQAQAILTELVFEHSLRVRFKAEAADSPQVTTVSSPVLTDSGSRASNEGDSDAEIQSVQTESTVAKGKAKETITTSGAEKKQDNIVGMINTLVTVDLDNVSEAKDFLLVVFQVPLELAFAVAFLYIVLGWSALVGFASIILLLPVSGYLATRMQKIQANKMKKTDARVQSVTETVGVLRMVKLFGWEKRMSETLKGKREDELVWIWKDKVINLLNDCMNFLIPTITMLVTYATYTVIMGKSLNASKIFSSMAVFDIVRNLLHRTSWLFNLMMKGKVSLDRVNEFLKKTELLDRFSGVTTPDLTRFEIEVQNDRDFIGFNNAVFSWSSEAADGTQTPSSRSFRLRIDGSLSFKRDSINLIIGPTGSGKTSILMALLGEMHFMPSSVDSWYNLPRKGGIAYAAQESWVQNETIKDNILFGSPYDEERYKKVIRQCALERDLELFEAGDQTEVGEKGLTLSGGQKARVTLARAVYSPAEIIILDDVLAALDVHTSKSVVKECLQGDLIRGRTVILVTHNVALVGPIADHVVSIGLDGVAREVEDISAALAIDPTLAREIENEAKAEAEAEVLKNYDLNEYKEKKNDGKLILAEEIIEGRVTWKSVMLFINGLGGNHRILFMVSWITSYILMHTGNNFSVWYLGYWGSQYDTHLPEEVNVSSYLSTYSTIMTFSVLIYGTGAIIYYRGTLRASRSINAKLVDSILGSTLRWLDETPASRIIARCTRDIAAVDSSITWTFAGVIEMLVCMISKLAGPVIFTPIFLLPGILIAVLGFYLGNIYLKAQMSVRREQSNARAPVLAHFGAAIAGLTSIRAYGAQNFFVNESLKRIDHYTKVSRTSYNLNRWIGIRIDLLGASFTTALASYLLIRKSMSAANIGFSLTMSLDFCSMILWLVRCYNDFEVQANSLERIQSYIEIDHEPKSTPAGVPPASWPMSGELQVTGLSARYSPTGPEVLHDLSFHVKSGERIGIVGRTGSGKSSLTLSLLRCILTEGVVSFDGLPTNKINLENLRSSITIIPQMPELLSGSLRRNLDPFEQHDDATLNNALRSSGLFSLQSDTDEARLTLDSDIASGGGNLSVGQRQIIALARAMIRNSKLLVLDEATSAIDHKTDTIIQSSLRNELSADVTILTIAHRLQTIMDADKIMVLDAGRIVEYDSPQSLLQKQSGYFKSLVDGSGDRKILYAMAERRNS